MRWNSLTCWILSAGCVIALASAAPVYSAGCAPGATCLPTQATGAPLPTQFVAQCSGTFPDFVTSPAMVVAVSATGPVFKLSQNYPSRAPADDAPWLNIDFTAGVRGANDYLYALRDYSFNGMINADFKPELNNVRPWFYMPMMNFGPNARAASEDSSRWRRRSSCCSVQRHPFIGHSSLLVARSAGQTERYSLPLSWIRKVDAKIFWPVSSNFTPL